MQWFELALNAVTAALLGFTIVYCRILNSRLRVLQEGKSELAALLKHFDESTRRASESIASLQQASRRIGEVINTRLEQANFAAGDLSLLIERAEKLSNRMEADVSIRRSAHKVEAQMAKEMAKEKEHAPHATATHAAHSAETSAEISPSGGSMRGLQAMLEQIAAARAGMRETDTSPTKSRSRSRAEQELLDVLKASKV